MNVCVVVKVDMVIQLRGFGLYGRKFNNESCYNRCHGNDVKGFWALWDSIYDCLYYFKFFRHL
jgi:hypothetical protein